MISIRIPDRYDILCLVPDHFIGQHENEMGRHDTQHNDTHHNDNQHFGLICDTEHY
jgi:hypothetical protein